MSEYFAVNITTGSVLTRKARSYSEIKEYARNKAMTAGITVAIKTQAQLDRASNPLPPTFKVVEDASFRQAVHAVAGDLAAKRIPGDDIASGIAVTLSRYEGVSYVPKPVFKARQEYQLTQHDVAWLIAASR